VLIEENIVSEGLFRVPPHSKLRDVLKEAYDRGQKYIVWKDNGATLPVPPYPNAELQDEIIAEVDPKDAYSVFMAAALIKAWYASLRQPIFPTSAYPDMRRLYGDPHDIPDLDRLRDLFSPTSEWSPLPGISRDIIVRHLLPLLHAVSSRHDHNKMTAENLAVCFAPALLCGPDQIEDAKMSSIIRRVFTHAVEMWQHGLREACAQAPEAFEEELKLPKDNADWDDPIEKERNSGDGASFDEQISGITLEDNEEGHESYTKPYPELSHEDMPPPPPPRSRVSSSHSGDSTKRKPAPPLQVPPRYSAIISDSPGDVAESPATYAVITDGFAPRREDDSRVPPLPPRWTSVSNEKSGTRNPTSTTAPGSVVPNALPDISPISSFTAKPNIPKRKTLTQQQVYNAERSGVAPIPAQPAWKTYGSETRNFCQPQSAMPLPGLTELPQLKIGDEMGSIPVPTRAPPPVPSTQSEVTCPVLISPGTVDVHPASATDFRRSSIPASTNRTPIISLARPVYPPTKTPFHPVTDRPISKSTSLPGSIPKPRTVSAGLLHRMPSLETQKQDETASVRNRMLAPKKLNLRKQSVEDLRKLYEERAGTASALIEAGRRNKHDETHVRWT
jgi:Rho GTPase-activating protein 1